MEGCTPLSLNGSNYTDSCSYITNMSACQLSSGFINYFQWQFCAFTNRIAPTILMFVWFLFLLIGVATTADSFLAPCLVIVGKTLRMSQNLAGVTLLALGNGAPDVFTSLSAIVSVKNPNIGLAFGDILGGGIFVNVITAGIIIIIIPFDLMHRPIIKDLIFYMLSLCWVMLIFLRRQIELWSSLIFLIMYLIYIVLTVAARLLYIKRKHAKNKLKSEENPEITVTNSNMPPDFDITVPSMKGYDNPTFNDEKSFGHLEINKYSYPTRDQSISLKSDDERPGSSPAYSNEGFGSHLAVPGMSRSTSLKNESNSGHDDLSVKNIQIGGFLNVPRFERVTDDKRISKISGTSVVSRAPSYASHAPSYASGAASSVSYAVSSTSYVTSRSNISAKRKYRIKRANIRNSTSHRSMGSFARIIIENEEQKELAKQKNAYLNIQPRRIYRSASLSVKEIQPKVKVRFYSWNESHSRTDTSGGIQRSHSGVKSIASSFERNEDIDPDEVEISETIKFPGALKHFLLTILPVDIDEWKEQSILKRILSVLQAPFMFLLTITVSVVEEGSFLNGWCKILNCFHCISSPVALVVLANVYFINFGTTQFNVVYLVLIIGAVACIIVGVTSKANEPPKYHPLFAFVGLVTSIVWIYELANEIVNILTVYAVVLNISETILGLSVLAFANSVGDCVSNITLARRNYPRIGYSACIGGPLFNILIGIGLPFTIKTFRGPVPFVLKSETVVLLFTIMLVTLLNLICLPVMKFRPRRFYGIILIIIYPIFLVLVILFATNVINVKP